ncbi:cobyric acid synthase CobQ, partial [Mycobacterium tuberculosis]
ARDGPGGGTRGHGAWEGDARREAGRRETRGRAPAGAGGRAARERRRDRLGERGERHRDGEARRNRARQ